MYIKSLSLINFRNYENENIEFCPGVNVLYGENGQGKTNVLEAVYMLSMGKSHRAQKDKEVISFESGFSLIKGEFEDNFKNIKKAEISVSDNSSKNIKINGISLDKISKLMGVFNVVLFCPEHLGLIKEGPKIRRKNLDILISQLRPSYFFYLMQYKKILNNRNSLIKNARREKNVDKLLDVWDDKLAEFASEIVFYRKEYLEKIEKEVQSFQDEITNKKEKLSIKYISCAGNIEDKKNEEIREILRQRIIKNRTKDIETGQTTVGIHRDDVEFFINDKNVKLYGSQGQQRTVVLTLKLAEVNIINNEKKEMPVILLDDILSELDKKRQQYILEKVEDMQALITCTDAGDFKNIKKNTLFYVKEGKICTST